MLPYDLGQLLQLIGYPGLFAIIFAESGTVIGFFLPGASLLFTAGFLASQGFLDIKIIVPLVALAAILGDNVGYWFGAKVGIHLFDKPDSRFFKREYVERTRHFYAKYGNRTILLARFIPIVRTFAPILAGIANMEYHAFMVYNTLGGLLWASGISYLGYLVGETIPRSADYIELVVLGIIIVTCIPLVIELIRKRKRPKLPGALVFDLDGTLAPSFTAVPPEMVVRLGKLIEKVPVAIMSAARFDRIERDLLSQLPPNVDRSRLHLFPMNGAAACLWQNGKWETFYNHTFTERERAHILDALKTYSKGSDVFDRLPRGDRIVDHGGYIAFTAIGKDASLEEKKSWDPSGAKCRRMQKFLKRRLPDFDVYIGGLTSVDVTQKGINKALAVRWLARYLGIKSKEMLFVGDALYPGGNDFAVLETGIDTRQVRNPTETAAFIDRLLVAIE